MKTFIFAIRLILRPLCDTLAFIWAMSFLIVYLSGCGKSQVDPEFVPYMNAFKDAAHAEGATVNAPGLNIVFGDQTTVSSLGTTTGEGGVCENGGGVGTQTIKISKQFWAGASDADKERVVFHELGHCILGRKHMDDTVMDISFNKVPKSTMNSSWPTGGDTWTTYRDEYVHELFHPGDFSI